MSRSAGRGSSPARGQKLVAQPTRLDELLAAGNLVEQVAGIIKVCAECSQEIAQQRTEQVRITEEARVQIEQIRSRRELLSAMLDRIFTERRENFRALFDRLDVASTRGDFTESKQVLDTIVSLAQTSPFQALREAATAHEALLDKGKVWEF